MENVKVRIANKVKDMSFKNFSIHSGKSIFNSFLIILFCSLFSCNQKTTNGKTLVVDVRSKGEWMQGHGRGINIPLPELEKHKQELMNYDTVIFVCEKGGRSQNALSYMNAQKGKSTVFKNGTSWTNYQ